MESAGRQAVEALRESEERFRNLIEGSIQGILIQRDFRPLFANQALADMLGYELDELLAMPTLAASIASYDRERIRSYSEARLRGEPVPSLYELDVVCKDGTIITLLNSVRSINWKGAPAIQSTFVDVTERRRIAERLEREKRFTDTAIDSLPGIFYLITPQGRFLRWNRNFETVSGYTAAEISRMHPLDFFRGRDRRLIETRIAEVFREGESFAEASFVARDGTATPYYFTGRRIEFENSPCLVGMGIDMSDRQRAAAALRESESRFRALYDDNPSMFLTLSPAGVIRSVNRFGARQLGYEAGELIGRDAALLHPPEAHPELRLLLASCLVDPGHVCRRELRKVRRDGSVLWTRDSARVVTRLDGAREILVVCEDISQARDLSEKLAYQASHDELTGLVNRREFEKRLARVLETARHDGSEHALCYLDLDQFKVINDTCGHAAGDELLRQLGHAFRAQVRQRDTLARLGGDEFGVLMEHCSFHQAQRVAEALRRETEDFSFAWEGHSFSVGVSIGVAPIDAASGTATQVLSAADAACYVAKDHGRNRIHLFRPDDAELTRRTGEMRWIARINDALQQDRLELALQPIVPLCAAADGGARCELLLRMRGEDGEIILPGVFLPAAERYNLSPRLDRWVIEHALAWLAAHPARLEELRSCSINLSALSLGDRELLEFVHRRIRESGVPAEKLCLEITETAAISNLTNARHFIESLKELGCSFALDDFGSGLSSFAYLKTLPVDFLKIDGIFVRDIVEDPVDHAMVRAIHEIAHLMGKRTIAEFVENAEILQRLRELGVDYAQGYHVGAPRPLDAPAEGGRAAAPAPPPALPARSSS